MMLPAPPTVMLKLVLKILEQAQRNHVAVLELGVELAV